MKVQFYDTIEDEKIKFVVIIARSQGKWVFCKHKQRDTLEVPGGHREAKESVLDGAMRELKEETGAIDFFITPVCGYSVIGKTRANTTGEESFGMLYYSEIKSFEQELHSEMERIYLLDTLPDRWTYPNIQPLLIAEMMRRQQWKEESK